MNTEQKTLIKRAVDNLVPCCSGHSVFGGDNHTIECKDKKALKKYKLERKQK